LPEGRSFVNNFPQAFCKKLNDLIGLAIELFDYLGTSHEKSDFFNIHAADLNAATHSGSKYRRICCSATQN